MEQEIWKSIEGFEGFYEVSNMGNVKGLDRVVLCRYSDGRTYIRPLKGKPLRFDTKHGYLYVCLSKEGKLKNLSVHRLVAMAFLDNLENKPQVNHKDENKQNNKVNNLEWNTEKENTQHAIKHGLRKSRKGESYLHLDKKMVNKIRTYSETGELSSCNIATLLGIPQRTVSDVISYRTHKSLNV